VSCSAGEAEPQAKSINFSLDEKTLKKRLKDEPIKIFTKLIVTTIILNWEINLCCEECPYFPHFSESHQKRNLKTGITIYFSKGKD
jgi:hypothetical protein